MNNETTTTAQTIAAEILQQLGGRKFVAMTGSKNMLFAEITESNPNIWLRMDLSKNSGKVNRLKIVLNANDTYTMKFYNQRIVNYTDVKISNEQTFEGVYCDQLREIFTKVTGLYTTLGTMGR